MDRIAVGAAIRRERERRGLTQTDVGEKAGITYQYVSEIERGIANVTLAALEAVATALELNVDVSVTDPKDDSTRASLATAISELSPVDLELLARAARVLPAVETAMKAGLVQGLENIAGGGRPR